MKKFGIQFLKCLPVIALGILFATPTFAAVYECEPTQAFGWTHGVLRKTPSNTLVETLKFDDQTGVLWVAATTSVAPSPTQFEIKQKMSPGNDLIGAATLGDDVHFITTEQFRIREWDKAAGLVYLWSDGERISTGRCVVEAEDTTRRNDNGATHRFLSAPKDQ
jgi:hypothetical protein